MRGSLRVNTWHYSHAKGDVVKGINIKTAFLFKKTIDGFTLVLNNQALIFFKLSYEYLIIQNDFVNLRFKEKSHPTKHKECLYVTLTFLFLYF